jgi:glutamyl endopeptidase
VGAREDGDVKRRVAAVGAIGVLVLGAYGTSSVSASGATQEAPVAAAPVDPHGIVASDGSRPVVAESTATVSTASPGTGVMTPEVAAQSGVQEVTIESVIGQDGRDQVADTTTSPQRAIAQILFNGGSICTGWLINANTLATAGHCVHEGFGGSFYPVNTYQVRPGRDGEEAPYGMCTAKALYTVNGWANGGQQDFDYGAIKLNCSVGNQTGWFGYFHQAGTHNGQPATVTGYPGDKGGDTMWTMSGTIAGTLARRLTYTIDTAGGQSGSPVWTTNNANCNGPCARAIHAYGVGGSDTQNSGTRIIQEVANNLTTWRNAK